MRTMKAKETLPNANGWQDRHNKAVSGYHVLGPQTHEGALVNMLKAWADYAEVHQSRFESNIGDDGVLGVYWQQIGEGIRGLLNGEAGRLDCGTLDGFILDTLTDNGINTENL